MPRTKIVCTLGPASNTSSVIRKLMLEGMDVARLNFSHGTHVEHLNRIGIIRDLNNRYRRRIRILQDLAGFRIRIGRFAGAKEYVLKKKARVRMIPAESSAPEEAIPFDYQGDLRDIGRGRTIFIDDGLIALTVVRSGRTSLEARVSVGGVLKERKGVNIPGAALKFGRLSGKDRADLDFGAAQGVDFVAQSFVRGAADVAAVRSYLGGRNPGCRIIAKIENREGIRNIRAILGAADGIMIARGDMGVSLPIYEIPIIQKQIIRDCNAAGKFVITATQMLESMVDNPRPTRAEVTDVANAIIDGTDYVMLSAETAAGAYPAEAVKMMDDIIVFTEKHRSAIGRGHD